MADITEDLLQTLAAGDPIAMLLVATAGKPAGRELRTIAAELLEARARIAKLEQEPPMTLVDFGYGLDLQGIRDDLKFLDDVRKQNQELRAEVERLRGLIREYVQATDGLAVEDSAEAQNRYERAEDALREVDRG